MQLLMSQCLHHAVIVTGFIYLPSIYPGRYRELYRGNRYCYSSLCRCCSKQRNWAKRQKGIRRILLLGYNSQGRYPLRISNLKASSLYAELTDRLTFQYSNYRDFSIDEIRSQSSIRREIAVELPFWSGCWKVRTFPKLKLKLKLVGVTNFGQPAFLSYGSRQQIFTFASTKLRKLFTNLETPQPSRTSLYTVSIRRTSSYRKVSASAKIHGASQKKT